jgi:hypothetical protein
MKCTVPSVKGLITLEYKNTNEGYTISLTLPEGMNADLYIPAGANVIINSEPYYQNGEYIKGSAGSVQITEK